MPRFIKSVVRKDLFLSGFFGSSCVVRLSLWPEPVTQIVFHLLLAERKRESETKSESESESLEEGRERRRDPGDRWS